MDNVVHIRPALPMAPFGVNDYGSSRDDPALRIVRAQSVLGLLPEKEQLALVRQSRIRPFPKNRVLFRTGDDGRSVVLVLSGYVKLSVTAANGREAVIEIARPGTIFGELAVLNGTPRQADAVALTDCRVMAIDGGLFRRAIASTPEAMFATIRLLSERLSTATAMSMEIGSLPAPVRLAKALLHLAETPSVRSGDHVPIGVRLSQRELGAMTGMIRESVNKHLKAWSDAGWIEMVNGSVTLCDVRALRDFVDEYEAA